MIDRGTWANKIVTMYLTVIGVHSTMHLMHPNLLLDNYYLCVCVCACVNAYTCICACWSVHVYVGVYQSDQNIVWLRVSIVCALFAYMCQQETINLLEKVVFLSSSGKSEITYFALDFHQQWGQIIVELCMGGKDGGGGDEGGRMGGGRDEGGG